MNETEAAQASSDVKAQRNVEPPALINVAGNHWDTKYSTGLKSAWTSNRLVQLEVNRRMTGNPEKHWLDWFFADFLDFKPKAVLSIGCGDGEHELMIAEKNYADYVKGFDASPIGIAAAQEKARARNLNAEFDVAYFEDFAANPPSSSYDLVLFAGALHHVRDIEGVLFAAQKTLRPGGLVLVNEYVGPAYQLFPPKQLEVINSVLDIIPSDFKISERSNVSLPTIEAIYAADPSEGARAPMIRALLPLFFSPRFERPFGGALLHGLFDCLDGSKINDGSKDAEYLVQGLIRLENGLVAHGSLSNDFMFGCYDLPPTRLGPTN